MTRIHEVSTPLTQEQNKDLQNRMFAGDTAARNELIRGNIALAYWVADRYVRVYPRFNYLYYDMVDEGFLAICESVGKLADEPAVADGGNVTGYLSKAIQLKIGNFLDGEATIRIPGRSVRRKRKSGLALLVPKQIDGTVSLERLTIDDPMKVVELRNLIYSCARSPNEELILEMAEQGYTIRQIAKRLGISKSAVDRMKAELYQRFLEKAEMKE